MNSTSQEVKASSPLALRAGRLVCCANLQLYSFAKNYGPKIKSEDLRKQTLRIKILISLPYVHWPLATYFVLTALSPPTAAWAAASLAMGTRYGEQLT